MQFTFNEGHIQLPSQWQDQSMQVLVSTDNSGINLVIIRRVIMWRRNRTSLSHG